MRPATVPAPAAVLALALAGLCAAPAAAQTGFYLPTAPTSYGQDEFRAADGTSCRSSMDGTKRVEVGTYASGGQTPFYGGYGYGYGYSGTYAAPMLGNAGVYGRFTMSLDAPPDRMDCNKLFELEMEKRRLEVELLKRSLVAADHQLDDLKAQRSSGRRMAEGGARDERRDERKDERRGTRALAEARPDVADEERAPRKAAPKRQNAPL